MASLAKADFFIVGAQKAGTTALHRYLSRHPEIQMPARKELHHFDRDGLDWSTANAERYNLNFEWTERSHKRGEATPIYFYWPHAMERLHAYNPNAKIIVGLRHPVFRAFSHWRMETARDAEVLTFEEATSSSGRQRVSSAPGGAHPVFSYIERGLYLPQFKGLFSLFPREQAFIFRTDDLWLNTREVLSALETFLGVSPYLAHAAATEYIVRRHSPSEEEIAPETLARLFALYADDMKATSDVAGVHLSDWLDLSYREPMIIPPTVTPTAEQP
ncbi:MAG: sulfotransferase [Pseudomonadota bacterium]